MTMRLKKITNIENHSIYSLFIGNILQIFDWVILTPDRWILVFTSLAVSIVCVINVFSVGGLELLESPKQRHPIQITVETCVRHYVSYW